MTDCESSEHIKYTTIVGSFVIALGILGVFLNSTTCTFFLKYATNGEAAKKRFKTVVLNMSIVDILLSVAAATIRGPGFIWPTAIYGDANNTVVCQSLSIASSWLLSDLNMLAIIPISCMCVYNLSKMQLRCIIGVCWILPILETLFIIIGIWTGNLDSHYTEEYMRCSIHNAADATVDWEKWLDYENMTVFNIMPLVVHGGIWISMCCTQPHMSIKKRLSGGLVVATALVTWLPYGIIYGIERAPPCGSKSLIYIFFHVSIVTNPLIYGYVVYKWQIFQKGCSECCFPDELDVPPAGSPAPAQVHQVQASFTDIGRSAGDMESSSKDRSKPQWQDKMRSVVTSES